MTTGESRMGIRAKDLFEMSGWKRTRWSSLDGLGYKYERGDTTISFDTDYDWCTIENKGNVVVWDLYSDDIYAMAKQMREIENHEFD